MGYTGKRRPRGKDREQWQLFFNTNSDRIGEFPNEFERFMKDEPKVKEKKLKETPEISLSDDPEGERKQELSLYKGDVLWCDALQQQIGIHDVDEDSKLALVRVVSYDILPIKKLSQMGLRKMKTKIIDVEKEAIVRETRKAKTKNFEISINGVATKNIVLWRDIKEKHKL